MGELLILYTGGTIGMLPSAQGLQPATGFEQHLRDEQAKQGLKLPAWRFVELSPPIDSANLTQAHWQAMHRAIVEAVDKQGVSAVLLLHGTDTLAYSAAALSFMLMDVPVPVVLTGSMKPAAEAGSDAWGNLFGALQAIVRGAARGVQLYFNGKLLPGVRASKLSSEALDAFAASCRPKSGELAVQAPAALHYRVPRRSVKLAVLPFYPGLAPSTLRAVLSDDCEALLLECYGSGTGPADNPQIIQLLDQAQQRGVLLAAISQCPAGAINFGVYAAGSALAQIGVCDGAGMSREAALGKLFSLLGVDLPIDQARQMFSQNWLGEC